VAQDIEASMTQLDSYMDGWQEGLAASRATYWPSPPSGARYHATDTGADTYYNGSAWVPQLGTADILATVMLLVYPVGCLYLSTTNVNPEIELGFGTWSAYGAGRVPIGVGTGTDANGNTMAITDGETGGEYTHKLSSLESGVAVHGHPTYDPEHTHGITDPTHVHLITGTGAGSYVPGNPAVGDGTPQSNMDTDAAATGITINDAATGVAVDNATAEPATNYHNIVQPFIGVNIWKRTA
jgi:hypothetical protein